MAINKKLIHFKTRAAFEAQLAEHNILDTSIVFIQDANLIWTHGTYYCLPSDEVVISNGIEPDNDQDLWIDTSYNTPVTFVEEAPTDGKRYVRKDGAWAEPLNEVYVGGEEPTNEETVWIDISKAYAEETLIINLASNQTNPDSNLNGVIVNVRYLDVDHKQAWRGEALSFKIPDGTKYTIEYSDITDSRGNKIYTTPTAETHTAVGNKIRTVTVTYTKILKGIYIYDNTGVLTNVENWNTSNNSSAIGVAVISDNCAFVIEKTVSYSAKTWGGSGTTISEIVTTSNTSTAKTDYAGKLNTTKIRNQLGSGNASAADYCRSRSCTVNGTILYGYLGALGEWQTAYNNKAAIDSALSKIGGTAMATDDYHWTSTQYNSSEAWVLPWDNNGYVSNNYKTSNNYVRAFYPLP